MKAHQLALQLYTLRDYCKTSADFASSMKKVKAIGYPAIQLSGVGPIPEDEIVKIVDGEGLVIAATHEDGDTIRARPQKVVDRLLKLKCRHTAFPHPGPIDLGNPAHLASMIADLDAAGALLRKNDLTLSYHNHGDEFFRLQGKTLLDHIYDGTDPKNLLAELDTYWIQYGGGDPVAWCEKMKNRLPLLHLKDFGFSLEENKPIITEIGNGNLDFRKIVAAAEASGCEWFIVEQDTCPGDPFESIKISFNYIHQNLIA